MTRVFRLPDPASERRAHRGALRELVHRLGATARSAGPPASLAVSQGPQREPQRELTDSGIVDANFYALALRLQGQAALPSPFIASGWLPAHVRDRWATGNVQPLLTYLASEKAQKRPLGPLFDARRLPEAFRGESRHPGGPLGSFIVDASDETALPVPEGYPGDVPTVGMARHALISLLTDLADPDLEPVEGGTTTSHGVGVAARTTVVILGRGASRRVVRAVKTLLREKRSEGMEVIVVDDRTKVDFALDIAATFLTEPRVRLLCLPPDTHPAEALNTAVRRSSGDAVVFLDGRCTLHPGWLDPVLGRLGKGDVLGVQPLVLDEASTIFSAGVAFASPTYTPRRLLAGHPPEDGAVVESRRFAALNRFGLALRAADFQSVGGFDATLGEAAWDVDLCLRIRGARPGEFVVLPEATITLEPGRDFEPASSTDTGPIFNDRWAETLGSMDPEVRGPGDDLLACSRRLDVTSSGGPVLRWGIRVASTAGLVGDAWGDTHLARSLAAALCAMGQQAVVYRRGLHDSPATVLDDVVLGIRGLVPIRPLAGRVNILWVISHPEEVSAEELVGFDLVYAASKSWSQEMSRRWGREIQPLLQATDSTKAPDLSGPLGPGARPLFVGSARERRRQVVHDALAAGLDVAVYGPGWQGKLAPRMYCGPYVDNDQLLSEYRRHGLVLADHWPSMAAEGFIANRIFDAVASGARVISDPVEGVEELFKGAVQTYESVQGLRELVGQNLGSRFPDPTELDCIARSVREEHSFEARVARLLPDALEVWRCRQGPVGQEGHFRS